MPEPHPSVAAVRLAVRRALPDTASDDLVLAGVSGGADSLALLAALAFEAPRHGRRAGVVHVDHGLQPGSAAQAERVAAVARELGLSEVQVIRPPIARLAGEGPEAAARRVRYAAFALAAEQAGSAHLFLAHSLDDQAEQVLLGLVRGSGTRSLAGMPASRAGIRRPLLHLTHATLIEACRRQGLEPWADPSNDDPAMTRNRVRHRVLPVLEAELGPGIAAALARTALLARADADLLDCLALDAWLRCEHQPAGRVPALDIRPLAAEPDALRSRVVRRLLLEAGAPAGDLTLTHVQLVDGLALGPPGHREISIPGGLAAVRRCDTLVVEKP